ncbi:ABC transporter ATP-binding protein [Deinococcus sp. Arct2-2]|uniref:ABC transporter ATP-binding protein n=1 Tax=Deinococcus sp. Arct2-2 TaxID=2568653 RepID=UPI0010A423B9|nr:ABC transporter ATP-binding protein [Deinococcus sp. Arct2-2]THF67928.1 ABC transporter ATP-binding protein [Deinococcus sp. Arct2-2]
MTTHQFPAALPPAIELHGLSKLFRGGAGLHPLELQIERGEIFGFLGPNGAGKTTTLRTLMGFLRPTSGSARVLGHDVWHEREAVHALVGYLPGELTLPAAETAAQVFGEAARQRGAAGVVANAKMLCERLELDPTRKIGTLSKGNKQKVGLVLALMHAPEVLLLDEPTDGLDPLAQDTVLTLLQEAQAEGRTVLLSSHMLAEVERVAQRVGIVRAGRLVRAERLDHLIAGLPSHLTVTFRGPAPTLPSESALGLTDLYWQAPTVSQGPTLRATLTGEPNPLLRALAGAEVAYFRLERASLEEAFLNDYRSQNAVQSGQEEPHA